MKLYENKICFIASMHQKINAITPSFESLLGCQVKETEINTDLLGTFTGEVERKLSPLECVKEKCLQGLRKQNAFLGVASEGSFAPDPICPFVHADHELLFFADQEKGFDLTLSKSSLETNFNAKVVGDLEELSFFAEQALFPSHGLIIRPHLSKKQPLIFKGIQKMQDLQDAFIECSRHSTDGKARVETDMRAHMNPTRMRLIADLAEQMALRLTVACPLCEIPGWGVVKKISGLSCQICHAPTELIRAEVYGCCKCNHQEVIVLQREKADPEFCCFCNP